MIKYDSNCWKFLKDNQHHRLLKEKDDQRLNVSNIMIKYIVYKTTNLINGKIYIGVHRTNIDFFDGYLGCGVKIGSYRKKDKTGLPAAIRKYGAKNFKRETLFEYPDTKEGRKLAYNKEEELVTLEFIKRTDVYNRTLGGKYGLITTLKKPIAQYTLDGKFIKSWESITDAELSLHLTSISNAILGITKYAGEWQWRYYNGDNSDIEKVIPKEKSVYQFDLQGNLIKCWKSASIASKTLNPENPNSYRVAINNCCFEKVNQAFGYYWSFKQKFEFKTNKHYAAVAKYDDDGNFLQSYTTLKEAAQACGLKTSSNIIACIKGTQKHCGGYRWRYFYGNTDNIPPLNKTKK